MTVTIKYTFCTLLIVSALTLGCTKKSAQLPANKNTAVDTLKLSVQNANRVLIDGEDSLLQVYVSKNYPEMKKTETGLWYRSLTSGQSGEKAKDLETVTISYEILSLDSLLLRSKRENIVLGKKQIINGIEEGLKLMHKGDKMLLIVPWYLAYGMKGDGNQIPPYTSVMVKVQLMK